MTRYRIYARTRFNVVLYFEAEVKAETTGLDTEDLDANPVQLGSLLFDDMPEEALASLLLALGEWSKTHSKRTADTKKAIAKIDKLVKKARRSK